MSAKYHRLGIKINISRSHLNGFFSNKRKKKFKRNIPKTLRRDRLFVCRVCKKEMEIGWISNWKIQTCKGCS